MLTHLGTRPIETSRLLLRPFEPADAPSVHANWASDPAVQSMYCEPACATLEETQDLLANYIAGYEKKDRYRWAIIEKASGECAGQIAYFLVDTKNHFGEIEYCIGQAFQRRGYCSEALRAVVAYGFERVRFHKVQVCHNGNNEASKGVIRKFGFTREGALRDYFYIDGAYIDRVYYSMLEHEWRAHTI